MIWGRFQEAGTTYPQCSGLPCEGVGGRRARAGKGHGEGLGTQPEPGAVNEAPPTPRPAPEARPGRRSPAAAPPLPWRRSGSSAPPLDHSGSGSPGPSARAFKLETSREAAPESRDRAPPPEVRWPSRDLGSAPPLGREGSSPAPDPEAPAPPPGSDVPRDLEPSAPHLRPWFPLLETLTPAPRYKGRKGHFPGRSCPAAGSRAQKGGPGWGQRRLPAAGQCLCGLFSLGRVSLFLGTPPRPGSRPESLFLSHVIGVKWANPIPVAPQGALALSVITVRMHAWENNKALPKLHQTTNESKIPQDPRPIT